MVALAIGLGIYSYLVLALGLLGLLYRPTVVLITIPFLLAGLFWLKKNFHFSLLKWQNKIGKDKLVWIILGILGTQVFINLLGALSPELSFDALWYHLAAAKIYVQHSQILYLPGWLLWPANVPRLADMFYVVALLFSSEILAKLIHFLFGILSAWALFNLLRRYFNLRLSLLGVVTFYTMLIVGWQSTTAYVELARTFFEILALDYFLQWVETKKEPFFLEAAVLTGLAIAIKILAFTTLASFLILILVLRNKGWYKQIFKFTLLTLLAVSPWLVLSFIHTYNPLFPVFGNFLDPSLNAAVERRDFPLIGEIVFGPLRLWQATFQPDSIISVVYLLFLPLVLVSIWQQKIAFKICALYVFLAFELSLSYSNRYLLPYLPGFTLVTLSVFNWEWVKKRKYVETFLVAIIIFSAVLNLGSRVLATLKFTPYLLGRESKGEFLSRNLNFSFGDFYDVDGFFARNIKKDDLVLIYDVHNLYYVDFPYIHESWVKPGTYFTHILVGGSQDLPEKFGQRLLLYQNNKTGVKLYLFGERYE